MMGTRAEVVAVARSLLETPYHIKARLPGIGIDCAGVLILAMRATGLKPATFDVTNYSESPVNRIIPHCDEHLERIERDQMQIGDVIVVRWGREPQHMGVLGDWRHGGLSIIHAENHRHKKVVEHRLWLGGSMQFLRAYRIPGIDAPVNETIRKIADAYFGQPVSAAIGGGVDFTGGGTLDGA